jgi:hypothetical protein
VAADAVPAPAAIAAHAAAATRKKLRLIDTLSLRGGRIAA